MTPLQLSILIHYRASACDFRDGDFSAPQVQSDISWFLGDAGLLFEKIPVLGKLKAKYRLTDKGEFFVDHLCNIPLPVNKWEIPYLGDLHD